MLISIGLLSPKIHVAPPLAVIIAVIIINGLFGVKAFGIHADTMPIVCPA